jgi:hypothetical protein
MYAFRKDGAGFRVIADESEIDPAAEVLSLEQPVIGISPAEEARKLRVPLLAAADDAINIAVDNGHDATALRAYRQQLRDVTKQAGFPGSFTWPAMPA